MFFFLSLYSSFFKAKSLFFCILFILKIMQKLFSNLDFKKLSNFFSSLIQSTNASFYNQFLLKKNTEIVRKQPLGSITFPKYRFFFFYIAISVPLLYLWIQLCKKNCIPPSDASESADQKLSSIFVRYQYRLRWRERQICQSSRGTYSSRGALFIQGYLFIQGCIIHPEKHSSSRVTLIIYACLIHSTVFIHPGGA